MLKQTVFLITNIGAQNANLILNGLSGAMENAYFLRR